MNLKPYEHFKRLKGKYPALMVRITKVDLSLAPGGMQAEFMRKMVSHKFKQEHGVEVTRWIHEYRTMDSMDPRLGLVYMASDSVVDEAMEVWGLVGHNLQGVNGQAG